MGLTVYGFHGRPHDFAVTKSGAPLEECQFLLDFTRRLERRRRVHWDGKWFGEFVWDNKWMGRTVFILVPVVHESEDAGQFVIGLELGEPYFEDIQRWWREHRRKPRLTRNAPVSALKIAADLGTHFPEDCRIRSEK